MAHKSYFNLPAVARLSQIAV